MLVMLMIYHMQDGDTPLPHGKKYTKEVVSLDDAGEYLCAITYKNESYEGEFSVHIEGKDLMENNS